MTARDTKTTPIEMTTGAENQRQAKRDALAKDMLEPYARHGLLAEQFAGAMLHATPKDEKADLGEYYVELHRAAKKAESGDLLIASRLLVAQAISLDGIFTEMARRGAANMREYPQAMEIYMRLALKAQAGSRATLAELAKLHQPREQTVRHVHVNEGGQAIITDQLHHHTGGPENGQSDEQPHATGTGAAGASPALSGPDPFGQPMPIPSRKRQGKVQDARRQG